VRRRHHQTGGAALGAADVSPRLASRSPRNARRSPRCPHRRRTITTLAASASTRASRIPHWRPSPRQRQPGSGWLSGYLVRNPKRHIGVGSADRRPPARPACSRSLRSIAGDARPRTACGRPAEARPRPALDDGRLIFRAAPRAGKKKRHLSMRRVKEGGRAPVGLPNTGGLRHIGLTQMVLRQGFAGNGSSPSDSAGARSTAKVTSSRRGLCGEAAGQIVGGRTSHRYRCSQKSARRWEYRAGRRMSSPRSRPRWG